MYHSAFHIFSDAVHGVAGFFFFRERREDEKHLSVQLPAEEPVGDQTEQMSAAARVSLQQR